MAERLSQRLAEEFEIRGTRVVSTASIGIVLCYASYGSAVEVLCDADAAMYEAKAAGRGRCVVFDATMRVRVQDRVKLERDLRLALENDELFLENQPIVSLRTGCMEGIQALQCWSHPQRGRVPPIEFLQLAEEAGLIAAIGEWALRIEVTENGIMRDPEQSLLLQSMDCRFDQGHLLGRPMPVERVSSYRRETPPALMILEGFVLAGCAT